MPISIFSADELFPLLLDGVEGQAFFVTDASGRIIQSTPNVTRWLGYEDEEFIGQRAELICADPSEGRKLIESTLSEGKCEDNLAWVHKNGTVFQGRSQVRLIKRKSDEDSGLAWLIQVVDEKYFTLFSSMDEGYCIIELMYDAEGKANNWRFLEINRAFEENNGLHDAQGKTILELAPNIEPKWVEIYDRVAQSGEPLRFEEDSAALNRVFSLYAFRLGAPEKRQVAVIFTDITERTRNEIALQEANLALMKSEEQFRALVMTNSYSLYHMNADWSEMVSLSGLDFLEDTTSNTREWLEKYIPVAERARVVTAVQKAIHFKSVFELEHKVIRADGTVGWTFSRAVPILDDAGKIVRWFGAANDVTARKKAEDNLKAAHQRTTDILESIADVFYALDENLVFTYLNNNAEIAWGKRREEILGKSLVEAFPAATESDSFKKHRQVLEQRQPLHYETISPILNRWIAVSMFPAANGGISVYFHDINERKLAEANLREAELRFRTVTDTVPVLIWETDANGIMFINQHYREFFQIDLEDVWGSGWTKLLHPDDAQGAIQAYQSAFENRRPYNHQCRFRRADGEYRWLLTSGSPFNDAHMLGFCADISETKENEQALADAQNRLNFAIDAADLGVCDWDYQRNSMQGNPQRFRMFGLDPSMGAMTSETFRKIIHPEDTEATWNSMIEQIHSKGAHHVQFRICRPDGEVRWIDEAGRVTEWIGDVPSRIVSMLIDITDHKEAERVLRRSRDELEELVKERTEKLAEEISQREAAEQARIELLKRIVNTQEEERGRISRELHDNLGQHLTAVILRLDALDAQLTTVIGTDREQKLPQLQALRIQVEEMMDAAHRQAWELRPAELDTIGLEAAIDQYVRDWKSRTGIEIEFQALVRAEERPLKEIETALYRVVQEALTNVARHSKASNAGVVLEITASQASAIIEDNGQGFDAEQNTGRLGVLGMKERLGMVGGTLEVESSPGQGTTIYARVPLEG